MRHLSLILISVTLTGLSAPAQATLIYNFVQNGTGDILSTLELNDPAPYDHNDVVDLSFTTKGDALFGLGVGTFGIPFTATLNGLIATDAGGSLISSTGGIVFIRTGRSDFVPGPGPNTGDDLTLLFLGSANNSEISLSIDFNAGGTPQANGEWTVIPEPASLLLLVLGGLALMRRRR